MAQKSHFYITTYMKLPNITQLQSFMWAFENNVPYNLI